MNHRWVPFAYVFVLFPRFSAALSISSMDHLRAAAHLNAASGPEELQEPGKLEELKQQEAELSRMLASVRTKKLAALRSHPLKIGVVGFGRFGQFIARTFAKHGNVVATSRSDYSELAAEMGVKYVPMSDPEAFMAEDLDVIVFCVSILSFKSTLKGFLPSIEKYIDQHKDAIRVGEKKVPLFVDVLSVKEHPRTVMLDYLPSECDVLCTHPMFGPDSGRNGWKNLNFVYEKTRIDRETQPPPTGERDDDLSATSQSYVEGCDRIERFLSIWEEEGCRMVPMSCREHDEHAANSQFITHLVGRVLGSQGLVETPIDTSGFQSVLRLMGSTTADSFDLFYGLYKYNENSKDTISNLQSAMNNVVNKLKMKEAEELARTASQPPDKSSAKPPRRLSHS